MKLGLIGVNPITQVVQAIQKENFPDAEVFIYDDDPDKQNKRFLNIPVVGSVNSITNHYKNGVVDSMHICFGEKYLEIKGRIFNELIATGIDFPNFIHQTCVIASTAEFGQGNVLNFGSIVGHNSVVKCNTSIWAGVVIEHDCILNGHNYIGPNVTLSGFVQVGECSLIGSGAVILPEIKIGKNCLIGAGAIVTRDVPDNTIVKGNPAK